MSTLRRSAVSLFLLGLVAAACSGGGGGGRTPTPGTLTPGTPAGSPAAQTSGPVGFTPGSYRYEGSGLVATLKLSGNAGRLEIENTTGHELGRPGLYVLDARDGKRIEGTVASAVPLGDGETASFDVTFPTGLEVKNIGLVILLMGGANLGAFAPA